jgi:PAS domain S-box-containing protein
LQDRCEEQVMTDEAKSQEELVRELAESRQRIAELEAYQARYEQMQAQTDATLSALREIEERFHAVADFANDWEYWVGPDGRFLYMSPSCEWITGYSPEQFTSDPGLLEAITHIDDRALIVKHIKEGLKHPSEAYIEFRIVTSYDEECWIEHLCKPVYGADGRYLGQRASNRDITARVEAQESLARLVAELSTLYDATTIISSDLSLDVVLGTVAEQMARALGASGCTLLLWDPERAQVETLVDYHTAGPIPTNPSRQSFTINDYPATHRVLDKCEPLLVQIDDAQADPAERTLMEQNEQKTLFMLPLVAKDRVLGLVKLTNDDETRDYTPAQIRLAESLGAQAAIAIENARLFDQAQGQIKERAKAEAELRRRNRELALLNRVITTSTSTLDVEYVLQITCDELARAFNLPYAAAILYNADRTHGTIISEYLSPGRPSQMGRVIPVAGDPLMEHLLESAAPLAIPDAQTHEWLVNQREMLETYGTASLLTVPMMLARGRVAGTIVLHAPQRREFSADEMTLAQNVAAAAGHALETARLYQALRRNVEKLEETVAQRTVELQDALVRAQDADRVKSEFVSNVSHELRTPLANLKLYLHLLTRGRPEKHESYLTTLRREVDRLQDLIEALLDVSRLDLGKTQANLRPVDLNLLMTTLVTDRLALVSDRGLSLDVDEDAELPRVLADPKLIEQVLTNLLTNAVNYTPVGGTITLRTRRTNAEGRQWVTASVVDTGPGISDDEKGRLFERFYRGEAGRASSAPGTGLGLAICKEIMDLHGGRITLESELGRGSIFSLWLDVAEGETA